MRYQTEGKLPPEDHLVSVDELALVQAKKEITVYIERSLKMYNMVKNLLDTDSEKQSEKLFRKITENDEVYEYTLGLSRYFVEHNFKIQSDLSYRDNNVIFNDLGERLILRFQVELSF